jgi:hypothetical protein
LHTKGAHDAYCPTGTGVGFYTDKTRGCFDVIMNSSDLVLAVIEKANISADKPFTIVDFGTADGGTSLPMLGKAVSAIKGKCADAQIHVIYEDQVTNDWASVFNYVHGNIPGGPSSYYLENQGVFVTACATSFFQQCVPNNSVDLGYCATAMHWLSSPPPNMKSALHHRMATKEETVEWEKQAAKDWETIITHRAKELAPGGTLVLVNFCTDKNGYFLGNSGLKYSMHDQFLQSWKSMVADGKITQSEFEATNFPNYYRNEEETLAPFKNPESAVSKAGLKLVSAETRITPCPYRANWLANKGDAKAHAKNFIPTTRTWSNATFYAGLDEKRPEAERRALVDEMYQRYEDKVAEEPEGHGMDYVHMYLVVRKD